MSPQSLSIVTSVVVIIATTTTTAFVPSTCVPIMDQSRCARSVGNTIVRYAEIREKTEKAKELAFGWDGTTALGGAVEVAKPARMLDAIRSAGETIPNDCEVFNANVEMDADALMFEEVMELIDTHYESQLLEFKNGDIVNKQGENEGSAKLLSYAALSNMDKETTLKLWGQYYREVLNDPNGTSHANIRNFMKYGWDGVPFENGIALTRKAVGDTEWDEFAESWIP
jgi:hypothetical protein